MNVSDNALNQLITCRKEITTPPRKRFIERDGCRRNDMNLKSADDNEIFSVFMRQNTILPEDYSIGLIWHPKDDKKNIILLRCNGPHGGNRSINSHFVTHIHSINSQLLEEDIYSPKIVEQTDRYSTFEDAISYFSQYCNIENIENYFPFLLEQSLF